MNTLQLGLLLMIIFFTLLSFSSSLNSDGLSLLALKAAISSDPSQALSAWSESESELHSTPCNWEGITCNGDHRVSGVSLSNKSFTGYIPSELGLLSSLTTLSLSNNNFSKLIPTQLFNASNLVSLDLSHNSLSGPIPHQISTLRSLSHLDLSSNLLNSSLPDSLTDLTRLAGTLNLSFNQFSGEVPASFGGFPVMVSLDLRHNNLTGKIPQVGSLLNQGPTAFSGNPNLCGFPLDTQCPDPEARNPNKIENPKLPISGSLPLEREPLKTGSVAAVPLISGGVSVVLAAVFVSMWVLRRKWRADEGKMGKDKFEKEEGQKGKFVVVEDELGLELEDLLRASAYVVGKGRSGIVYKVVVVGRGGSGVAAGASAGARAVAVRRLTDGDESWVRYKDFEAEVDAIVRVRHPNIVRLRAYYYADDEKLLVSDFIRNGSLYTALHGGGANSLLSWATRLKIAQGAARGVLHIHECSPRKYVHGNIKSSKILLDDDLLPHVSGFGLTRLVSKSSTSSTSTSTRQSTTHRSSNISLSSKVVSSSIVYMAPEARLSSRSFTQKSDVYSFGIVLMELLTGLVPDSGLESLVRKAFREEMPLSEIIDPALVMEVYSKKQVVAAFHVALNCTELDPEVRPRMRAVLESLDRCIKL